MAEEKNIRRELIEAQKRIAELEKLIFEKRFRKFLDRKGCFNVTTTFTLPHMFVYATLE